MKKDSDGIMNGMKDDIVSWWRGTLGDIAVCYEDRNWGYAFYLMAAICADNSDGSPITKGLLEQIDTGLGPAQSRSFWEELMVFLLVAFGLILNTPVR